MNFIHTFTKEPVLLDRMAEELLNSDFSISFRRLNELEFLSASLHGSAEAKFFMAFDPVETNAAVFLESLVLLNSACKGKIIIVVPAEGEQEILLNILKMQKTEDIEVLCLSAFSRYPLQLVR